MIPSVPRVSYHSPFCEFPSSQGTVACSCGALNLEDVAGSIMPKEENINHPSHYGGDTVYEVIKVIEAWGLGFRLGNAVKYIARAGKKGATLDDLKKAVWYINREIEKYEDKGSGHGNT